MYLIEVLGQRWYSMKISVFPFLRLKGIDGKRERDIRLQEIGEKFKFYSAY